MNEWSFTLLPLHAFMTCTRRTIFHFTFSLCKSNREQFFHSAVYLFLFPSFFLFFSCLIFLYLFSHFLVPSFLIHAWAFLCLWLLSNGGTKQSTVWVTHSLHWGGSPGWTMRQHLSVVVGESPRNTGQAYHKPGRKNVTSPQVAANTARSKYISLLNLNRVVDTSVFVWFFKHHC